MAWFTTPVIGDASLAEQTAALRDLIDTEDEGIEAMRGTPRAKGGTLDFQSAATPKGARGSMFPWQRREKLWLHTGHAFGFIAPQSGAGPVPIHDIGAIRPDRRLAHARVKITLDRLHVASYPGSGVHHVLLHFFAQHQTEQRTEDLHYNAIYRAGDGAHAGVRGFPLFVGLGVGTEGLRMKFRTINVGNEQDFALLDVLESDVFRAGLKLVSTAQPAIAPFSALAFGIAKTIASKNKNISVQDVHLGLDFHATPTGGRLAQGSYLVVQIPQDLEQIWSWDAWAYQNGHIIPRYHTAKFSYNYIVFSIVACRP